MSPSPQPPLATETFCCGGYAETRHGEPANSGLPMLFPEIPISNAGNHFPSTESSTSEQEPPVKTGCSAQASSVYRDEVENMSSNNIVDNVYHAEDYAVGDKVPTGAIQSDADATIAETAAWENEAMIGSDDDWSNQAFNGSGEEDLNSVYSSYSTRNDEISITCHGDSTVSYQDGVACDFESQHLEVVDSGFELTDGNEYIV